MSLQCHLKSNSGEGGSFMGIKNSNMGNNEEFQEVFLDDDDDEIGLHSNKGAQKQRKSKKSMILPIQEYINTDNDDCYKSLTPVNEVQSFIPSESSSATTSVRTSLSLTSDSSTPKLETRKISYPHSENVAKTALKKSSTSNTLKEDYDEIEELSHRPKVTKQEKFCYNKFDDSSVSSCQCAECFEIRDRASFCDAELSPSNSTPQNKSNPYDSELGRQSSSESVFWTSNQYKSVEDNDLSDNAYRSSAEQQTWQRKYSRQDSDSSSNTCSRSR